MTVPAKYGLTEAHFVIRDLKKALAAIDILLTTVDGDNLPRGEACKAQVRFIAREALKEAD